MKIKKGTKLKVKHNRKGTFVGIAEKDFDSNTTEFYPICVAEEEILGLSNYWQKGDRVPCRASLCTIEIIS